MLSAKTSFAFAWCAVPDFAFVKCGTARFFRRLFLFAARDIVFDKVQLQIFQFFRYGHFIDVRIQ